MEEYTLAMFLEELPTLEGDERAEKITRFLSICSGPTKRTLKSFQEIEWDEPEENWDILKKGQQRVIEKCALMETNEFGTQIRKALGLEPITMETAI